MGGPGSALPCLYRRFASPEGSNPVRPRRSIACGRVRTRCARGGAWHVDPAPGGRTSVEPTDGTGESPLTPPSPRWGEREERGGDGARTPSGTASLSLGSCPRLFPPRPSAAGVLGSDARSRTMWALREREPRRALEGPPTARGTHCPISTCPTCRAGSPESSGRVTHVPPEGLERKAEPERPPPPVVVAQA